MDKIGKFFCYFKKRDILWLPACCPEQKKNLSQKGCALNEKKKPALQEENSFLLVYLTFVLLNQD